MKDMRNSKNELLRATGFDTAMTLRGHRIYWPAKWCVTVKINIIFDCSSGIIHNEGRTKGEMNTMGNSHTPSDIQQTMTLEPPHHAQDQACDKILHGFEPQDVPQPSSHKGCGHHIHKPSVYVHDIHKGRGVASTHQNNPVLPTRLQAHKYTSNLTIF